MLITWFSFDRDKINLEEYYIRPVVCELGPRAKYHFPLICKFVFCNF